MQKKPKTQFDKALDTMMSEAWDETKSDFSYGSALDKVTSSAKLLGKGAVFAGVKVVKTFPEIAKKHAAEVQAKKAKEEKESRKAGRAQT